MCLLSPTGPPSGTCVYIYIDKSIDIGEDRV